MIIRDWVGWLFSRLSLIVTVVVVFATAAPAQDEQQPQACAELGNLNNFFVIDSIRSRLQIEIPQMISKKKEIEEVILPQVEQTEQDLEETEKKLEALQRNGNLNREDSQFKDLEKVRTSLKGALRGKTVESLNEERKQLEDDISWKEQQQKCVNAKIQGYSATPEQDFKRTMSVIFSILIGLVILGFFVMAYRDGVVRQAIFSGQTGLQFVTLFSIVIAIILFGITGILEDKELAALLGGLSGYILGRSSIPRANGSTNPVGGLNSSASTVTPPNRIEVSPASLLLTTTAPTSSVSATAFDAQNEAISGIQFEWESDDPNVATVDQVGLVTRTGVGSCNVIATFNGQRSSACGVTCQ